MVTLREKYPLEKKKVIKKSIDRFVPFFFILFILTIIGIQVSFTPISKGHTLLPGRDVALVLILLYVIVFMLLYVYETFYIKHYFYDLVEYNLIIRKGVFSRNEITLPLSRLQDVYVDQDVLDRIFGLYDVHVSSATTISGNLSHIDGLNKENSEAIKKLILTSIHKK